MLYRPALTPELAKQNKAHLERQESLRARAASIATSIEEVPPEPQPQPQVEAAPVMKEPWFSIEEEIIPEGPRRPKVEEIQRTVARAYSITKVDLCSQRRHASIVRPRQIAMYLAKTMTHRSLPEIGRRFGGRDHTTVLHAVRKMEALRGSDEKFDAEITLVESLIAGSMQ